MKCEYEKRRHSIVITYFIDTDSNKRHSIYQETAYTIFSTLSNLPIIPTPPIINNYYNVQPPYYSNTSYYSGLESKLDRHVGSCNILKDLSNKVCVRNKTEDLNKHVFDMIAGKSESRILTKDISR